MGSHKQRPNLSIKFEIVSHPNNVTELTIGDKKYFVETDFLKEKLHDL